jgi:NAD(P)H dehydrogenase (quinone)
MNVSTRIMVTGAGGALGRRVIGDLAAAGHPELRAGSRHPARLADLVAAGVEVVPVDFDAPATLDAAFAGITRALIVSTDALSEPGQRRRQHAAALAAAVRAGVRHVAYTSMPDPARAAAIPFAADHAAMEAGLRASGLAWTSLRNSWYQENLLGYLPQIVRDGTWFTAAGQGRIAYVARDDAAAAAATVLAGDGAHGAIDIAGPQALTVDALATVVGATLGRPLHVRHVDPATLRLEMARQGVHADTIAMVAVTEANQRASRFDVSAQPLATLLGRPPRMLDTFLRVHADAFLSSSRSRS